MGVVLSPASHAACTKGQVEWLESMGYSVERAMGWCSREAAPPSASKSGVKEEPPQAAPSKVRYESSTPLDKTSRFDADATKYAQLLGDSNRGDDTNKGDTGQGGQNQGGTNQGKDKSERSTLADFSTKKGNGSNLVTAHIATAFAPMFLEASTVPKKFKAISLDISAAIPAQSTTLKDYGKQALLSLDGGIVNIYGSLPGYDHQEAVQNTSPRNFDRNYWVTEGNLNQLLVYTKGGLGGRAIKTALEGNGYAGLATAYLGLGVDGPLLATRDGSAKDPKAGWVFLEAFGVANAGNKTTFEKLFGAPTTKKVIPSWGSNFSITLPGQFYMTVGYYRALGDYGKSKIGGTTVLAFGYNGGPEAKKQEEDQKKERVEQQREKQKDQPRLKAP